MPYRAPFDTPARPYPHYLYNSIMSPRVELMNHHDPEKRKEKKGEKIKVWFHGLPGSLFPLTINYRLTNPREGTANNNQSLSLKKASAELGLTNSNDTKFTTQIKNPSTNKKGVQSRL